MQQAAGHSGHQQRYAQCVFMGTYEIASIISQETPHAAETHQAYVLLPSVCHFVPAAQAVASSSSSAPFSSSAASSSNGSNGDSSAGAGGPTVAVASSSPTYAPEDTYDVIVVGAGHAGEQKPPWQSVASGLGACGCGCLLGAQLHSSCHDWHYWSRCKLRGHLFQLSCPRCYICDCDGGWTRRCVGFPLQDMDSGLSFGVVADWGSNCTAFWHD